MEGMDNMLIIFNVVIGGYATYAAIVGKGAAYKNDYPKAIQADANALLRRFLFILGPLLLLSSAIEYFNLLGSATKIFTFASIIAAVVIIVVYIVLFRKRFGKYLK